MLLNSAEYSRLTTDELLLRVAHARAIRLHLDGPVSGDVVRACVFLASVSRQQASLKVEFPYGQASREVSETLDLSPLGPLIWGDAPKRNIVFSGEGLLSLQPQFANAERNVFCSHTSFLSTRRREDFRTDMANGLRAAAIYLPRDIFGTLTGIGFELNSNAEEYGVLNEHGEEMESFRVISVSIRSRFSPGESTLGASYLREYARTHTEGNRWLEVVVADSGVGMTYPTNFVGSGKQNRSIRDIYLADIAEERKLLKFVLDEYHSTKGRFGKRLNLQTAVGEGTKIVRYQIAAVRGFVGVRTGRCQASWWHASRTLNAVETRKLSGFEVSERHGALFRGTVWHVLIPLDTQFSLL